MRSLDILMVASEGPPTRSGIARTITHLRDGFAARGHRVEVVSFPRIPRAVFGEVRLSGLLFHQQGLGRQLDEYDVVHVHGSAPTVSDVFLLFSKLRGRRAPLVYTHHCDIEVGPARQLNTLYNRLHHRPSSKVGGAFGAAVLVDVDAVGVVVHPARRVLDAEAEDHQHAGLLELAHPGAGFGGVLLVELALAGLVGVPAELEVDHPHAGVAIAGGLAGVAEQRAEQDGTRGRGRRDLGGGWPSQAGPARRTGIGIRG